MKVLHLDTNHPLLIRQLAALGCQNTEEYSAPKNEVEKIIHEFEGVIIRSRFKIDKTFLEKATRLKFIGRVGAGLENIDVDYAREKGIFLAAAPEGNRNAVGEQALGMLLSLMNNLNKADREVRQGIWDREGNRGWELDGKTVGLIGYGNTGQAFAKKLSGFDVEILCHDILEGVGNAFARQVGIEELQEKADVVSLHVPQTSLTLGMVNTSFIKNFAKPFWFLNTARGKCVKTADLVEALKTGKVLGAGLDVLEYEKTSFEDLFEKGAMPEDFKYLVNSDRVLLSPHIAGWTQESKVKLAQTLVDKIKARFFVS
ncbi:D-3-phosphoglycerate dehydrogenase [Muriicola jejuensis]|uniref:2-hydroxyacid dehydrogenase n=1 Tax=Muriicola jejuensis TaxID=504488 RepID=UPI0024032245|nr:2-hydroxyacid dehydrogenase [Muriicola jejuensis]SMP06970.1 D-3-phosphoglycerate dehydrogenase [Muriicola jejuensis]